MSERTVHIPVTREVRCERVGTLKKIPPGMLLHMPTRIAFDGAAPDREAWTFVLACTDDHPIRHGYGLFNSGDIVFMSIVAAADGDVVYLVHDEEP